MKIVLVKKEARGFHRVLYGLCNIADGFVIILSLSFLQAQFALDYAKYRAKQRMEKGFCK